MWVGWDANHVWLRNGVSFDVDWPALQQVFRLFGLACTTAGLSLFGIACTMAGLPMWVSSSLTKETTLNPSS